MATPSQTPPLGVVGGASTVNAPTRGQTKDGGSSNLGTFGVWACAPLYLYRYLSHARLHCDCIQVKSGLAQMLKVRRLNGLWVI